MFLLMLLIVVSSIKSSVVGADPLRIFDGFWQLYAEPGIREKRLFHGTVYAATESSYPIHNP